MDLRPYLPTDRRGCLAIFDSNVPHYLSPAERLSFEKFLDHPGGPYFVMEHEGALVGCGGYHVEPDPALASLQWGMVRGDAQKMGLGRFLLMYRLRELGKLGTIQRVRAETSPPAAPFFEGQGFKVLNVSDHRVELLKKLSVCP